METIPVVDLADFLSNDINKKNAFVNALGKAYETVGFVAVKNHGIPDELIQQLYDQVQRFFSLPLKIKGWYEIKGLSGQRGYTSFGKEHAKGSDAPDLKEFFQFGQTVGNNKPGSEEEYPENIDVKEMPDFKNTLYNVYRQFEQSGGCFVKGYCFIS